MPIAFLNTEQTLTRSVRSETVFMHPPSKAIWQVTLPITPTVLTFRMGIDPKAWGWMGDGVIYEVRIDEEKVFTHTLTPELAQEGWQPGQVELSRWAGQKVRLTLATDPGLAYDGQGDWAGWGDIQLVGKSVAYEKAPEPQAQAVAAWRQGGFKPRDFFQAGKVAQQANRSQEARDWLTWAVWMQPDWEKPRELLRTMK